MSARVLVVDDEPQIRALIERLIRRIREPAGITVDTAGDVDAAIARLEAGAYDLVLSDFRMPGRDGLSLLGEVRERWPRTTRCLMSGYSDEQLPSDARERAELSAFIRKPWSNAVLVQTVTACLTGEPHHLAGSRQQL